MLFVICEAVKSSVCLWVTQSESTPQSERDMPVLVGSILSPHSAAEARSAPLGTAGKLFSKQQEIINKSERISTPGARFIKVYSGSRLRLYETLKWVC